MSNGKWKMENGKWGNPKHSPFSIINSPLHTHRFRLTANLALSPPDSQGYVRKLFIRECPLCPGAEVVHGVEHVDGDVTHNRLTSWEEWNALGFYDGNAEEDGVAWDGER